MEQDNSAQETIVNQNTQQNIPEYPVKQKGFLLPVVGIILFLVIVGAGAYYLGITKPSIPSMLEKTALTPQSSPTTNAASPIASPSQSIDQTASWKTYDNQNQKGVAFSIKYPSDKKVDINATDPYIGFCNLGTSLVSIDLYNPDQQIPSRGLGTDFRGFLSTTVTMQLLQYDLTADKWISDNCKGSWVLSPNTSKKSINVQGAIATQYTGGEFGTGRYY